MNLKYTLPTECTADYSPSIGKDLVVGESSEEVLRKVGKPNEAIKGKGYTYYVYFVQPYLLREIGGKYLGVCGSGAYADSSGYYITFDADKKIESIVYYLMAGADSQRVKVPGADGLMLPAASIIGRVDAARHVSRQSFSSTAGSSVGATWRTIHPGWYPFSSAESRSTREIWM